MEMHGVQAFITHHAPSKQSYRKNRALNWSQKSAEKRILDTGENKGDGHLKINCLFWFVIIKASAELW